MARIVVSRKLLDETLALLGKASVRVTSSEYRAEAFGSWLIACDTSPPSRVVWDGKEAWLLVQTRIDRWGDGEIKWIDQLSARADVAPTAAMAVNAIVAATSPDKE